MPNLDHPQPTKFTNARADQRNSTVLYNDDDDNETPFTRAPVSAIILLPLLLLLISISIFDNDDDEILQIDSVVGEASRKLLILLGPTSFSFKIKRRFITLVIILLD